MSTETGEEEGTDRLLMLSRTKKEVESLFPAQAALLLRRCSTDAAGSFVSVLLVVHTAVGRR
jgi:hypothetical protein